MTKHLGLSRVQGNTKRQENQNQTSKKLNDQSISCGHHGRVDVASSHGELTRAVRGVHGEACESASQCLASQVEDHARESDNAGEEGGESNCGADVATAGGREGVDEQRSEEEVGEAAECWGEEGDCSVNAGLAFGRCCCGEWVSCYPAGDENVHHTCCWLYTY